MSESSFPPILQAEAYYGGDYVLIRNSKTENAVELTKCHPNVSERIFEVPDFAAFLAMTAGPIKNSRVIVTLGDSRTANFSNWPRVVAITHLQHGDSVVLNLADWACCSEDHVATAEYSLGWLKQSGAKDVSVILFGELIDLHRKLACYTEYTCGRYPQPFLDQEDQLSIHRYGSELARLHDQVPDDLDAAAPWISQRVVAIANLIDKLCLEAGAKFIAILEPNAYGENSPGYLSALHRAHAENAPPDLDFEIWCQQRSYARDPSEFFKQDIRPLVRNLQGLWRAQQRRASHGLYADLSDLFRTFDGCCFTPSFDAIHYNESGVALIANALAELLRSMSPDGREQKWESCRASPDPDDDQVLNPSSGGSVRL
jgi:hypothetical protein